MHLECIHFHQNNCRLPIVFENTSAFHAAWSLYCTLSPPMALILRLLHNFFKYFCCRFWQEIDVWVWMCEPSATSRWIPFSWRMFEKIVLRVPPAWPPEIVLSAWMARILPDYLTPEWYSWYIKPETICIYWSFLRKMISCNWWVVVSIFSVCSLFRRYLTTEVSTLLGFTCMQMRRKLADATDNCIVKPSFFLPNPQITSVVVQLFLPPLHCVWMVE